MPGSGRPSRATSASTLTLAGRGTPLFPLSVKLATVANAPAEMPQRNLQSWRRAQQVRPRRLLAVRVLVGIEVGRIAADQLAKPRELRAEFLPHGRDVIG